jgi:hypothetical protein
MADVNVFLPPGLDAQIITGPSSSAPIFENIPPLNIPGTPQPGQITTGASVRESFPSGAQPPHAQ